MIEGTLVVFLNEHVMEKKTGVFHQTFLLTKDLLQVDQQHPNSHEHMHIYVAHSLWLIPGLQNA